MHEFGYTFKEIEELTPAQLNFLAIGLELYSKEIERRMRRARPRRRKA